MKLEDILAAPSRRSLEPAHSAATQETEHRARRDAVGRRLTNIQAELAEPRLRRDPKRRRALEAERDALESDRIDVDALVAKDEDAVPAAETAVGRAITPPLVAANRDDALRAVVLVRQALSVGAHLDRIWEAGKRLGVELRRTWWGELTPLLEAWCAATTRDLAPAEPARDGRVWVRRLPAPDQAFTPRERRAIAAAVTALNVSDRATRTFNTGTAAALGGPLR